MLESFRTMYPHVTQFETVDLDRRRDAQLREERRRTEAGSISRRPRLFARTLRALRATA
jgi:hypothetical protein